MMKRNHMIPGIGSAIGICILILDGKTALAGANEGIELCIRTVIPSLFPFFLLSIALTASIGGQTSPLFQPLQKLCRIPKGSESILLTGFLGGYPVGAQAVANAFTHGNLTRAQAERMLSFCSNAGPAFLFGIIGSQYPGALYPWLLWGIHLLSAVAVSFILPPVDNSPAKASHSQPLSAAEIMRKATSVMAQVCGWIIIFRVILKFLDRWVFWLFPKVIQILLMGLLELSNGCCSLSQIENVGLRFLVSAVILSFGGLCVTMQTVSVIGNLSTRKYIQGKLLQTLFSIVLASACQSFFPRNIRFPIPMGVSAVGIAAAALLFVLGRKNYSRNPEPYVV